MEKSSSILKNSSLNGNGRQHDLRRKLLEFEEDKKAIFEACSDAIFAVHPATGEILEANGKAAVMAGYPVPELQGMNFEDLIPVDDISSPLNGNGRSGAMLKRHDGTSIHVDVSVRSVHRGQEFLKLVFVCTPGLEDRSRRRHFLPQKPSVSTAKDDLEPIYEFPAIIGKSEKIRKICQLIGQVAKTDSTVLIQGESGTGKEIVAQAIHFHSRRSKGPFVKINCAALTETLLESELFGHVKGAFTGAIRDHCGRFRQADGGTILLDEINAMSVAGQAKFLRVLQEREFEPVGSSTTKTVNVRVIVASNANLEKAVAEGTFRDDLYYRLNVFSMLMPPLREKKEDIPLLARHFLRKHNLAIGKEILDLTPETLALMMQYDWPGNVRELENAVEHAVIIGKGKTMLPSTLPANITMNGTGIEITNGSVAPSLRERLNLLEKQIILDVLMRTNGVKKQAAAMLQIDPRNFPYLLRKHNLAGNSEPNSKA